MNKIYKLFVLSMIIMFVFGCKKNSGAEVKKIVLDSERKVSTKNLMCTQKTGHINI